MIQEGNSKKEPLTAVVISSAPKLIRVVAPTNLPGGYQLEVQTDNDPPTAFTATVVRNVILLCLGYNHQCLQKNHILWL